ncbi:hypothetical protein FRC07_006036, partial [Ceratobasidium sp. 392]
MRITPRTITSESTTPSPINILPPEVLANIFTLLDLCLLHYHPNNPYNFTEVCAHWRHIALSTTNLWAHIDFGSPVRSEFTDMLLERTKDGPIHAHIREETLGPHSAPINDETLETMQMLEPHMPRVRALEFDSYKGTRTHLLNVLELWFRTGSPTLAKSFTVRRPNTRTTIDVNVSTIEGKAILRSLCGLDLDNVKFNWDSNAYHGLVDLRLNFTGTPTYISTSQLVNILLASPELSTLSLSGLAVAGMDKRTGLAPIMLCRLQDLCLHSMNPETLLVLLPLLALPCPSAEVTIGPTNFSCIYQEVERLIGRSRIAKLHCTQDHLGVIPEAWTSLLGLHSLSNMTLHQFHMDSDGPMDDLSARNILSLHPTGTLNVTLWDCTVTPEGLKVFAAQNHIKRLHLKECEMVDGWRTIPMSQFDFGKHRDLKQKCDVSERPRIMFWD